MCFVDVILHRWATAQDGDVKRLFAAHCTIYPDVVRLSAEMKRIIQTLVSFFAISCSFFFSLGTNFV